MTRAKHCFLASSPDERAHLTWNLVYSFDCALLHCILIVAIKITAQLIVALAWGVYCFEVWRSVLVLYFVGTGRCFTPALATRFGQAHSSRALLNTEVRCVCFLFDPGSIIYRAKQNREDDGGINQRGCKPQRDFWCTQAAHKYGQHIWQSLLGAVA